MLGHDAMIDDDGRFITSGNDYMPTTEEQTILQAISCRLAEKKGRQIRDGSYGIVAQIGEALNNESPFEFLAVSLQETLVQDPRITNVYGLKFRGSGDSLQQEFKFDTITRKAVTFREGL